MRNLGIAKKIKSVISKELENRTIGIYKTSFFKFMIVSFYIVLLFFEVFSYFLVYAKGYELLGIVLSVIIGVIGEITFLTLFILDIRNKESISQNSDEVK